MQSRMMRSFLHGPVMTFDVADIAMKTCCCVATLATFKRVVDEQNIPRVFLCLPSLLLLLFILQKFTQLRDDPATLGMVTGALIGVLTGFLSAMERLVQADVPGSLDIGVGPDPIYNLELLHIPVVLGAVMYSFTLSYERMPSGHRLRLAGVIGLVGAVLVTTGLTVLEGDISSTATMTKLFPFAFLAWFLVGLLPSAPDSHQAWIVCTVIWLIQLMWQSRFFDALVWDWQRCKFPIPGFLTGMIVVFFGDVITCRASAKHFSQPRRTQMTRDPMEPITNCFLWHAITFVVQRISLYIIESKKVAGPFTPKYPFEAAVTCVITLALLYVTSVNLRGTTLSKVMIGSLGLLVYVFSSLNHLALPNGMFLDIVLGILCVYTVQTSQLDHV